MNKAITEDARRAIEKLGTGKDDLPGESEDQLFAELGKRLTAINASQKGSDSFDMTAGTGIESYGPMDTLKNLGRRFFHHWNKAAFSLVCGTDAEDQSARDAVKDAFQLGPEAIAATIAALLVTHFGLAAALAAVVGTLVVRLFIKPGHQGLCDCWKDSLPQE